MAKMFINGEWAGALSGDTYPVKNPANGEVIDTVPLGAAEDARSAVAAAKTAFKEWANTLAKMAKVRLQDTINKNK